MNCSLLTTNRDFYFILFFNNMLLAPPRAPVTPSVVFSPPGQQFTITWNEPPLNMGETFDAYFLNISGPDDLCGSVNTLLRFGNSTHSYACSGWSLPEGQMYTFTVQAANCGGVLRGPKSRPVTVSIQGMYIKMQTVNCVNILVTVSKLNLCFITI